MHHAPYVVPFTVPYLPSSVRYYVLLHFFVVIVRVRNIILQEINFFLCNGQELIITLQKNSDCKINKFIYFFVVSIAIELFSTTIYSHFRQSHECWNILWKKQC